MAESLIPNYLTARRLCIPTGRQGCLCGKVITIPNYEFPGGLRGELVGTMQPSELAHEVGSKQPASELAIEITPLTDYEQHPHLEQFAEYRFGIDIHDTRTSNKIQFYIESEKFFNVITGCWHVQE